MTAASQVQVAQKNPALGTVTEEGAVLMDGVCVVLDSQVRIVLKRLVLITATTEAGV